MQYHEAMRLPREFYTSNDVVAISRDLLGKVLCTRLRSRVAKAVITETEAYAGVEDRASHAYGGRRTARTEPMYAEGGTAYVYLCYGIHHLFNVVAGEAGSPLAVLVRAGRPVQGADIMRRRRKRKVSPGALLAGPGCLSQALGITTRLTGASLLGERIWIEDHGLTLKAGDILVGARVGIDYAGDDAGRPYRFRVSPSIRFDSA
jgi:DNA-3-methyladenine glycosylase